MIKNTVKHAGSDASVAVTLAHREGTIELEVSDDGTGISSHSEPSGFGITGMRDRIEAAGGRFEVISTPGEGTSMHATIPDGET